jgi:hypothetical protein
VGLSLTERWLARGWDVFYPQINADAYVYSEVGEPLMPLRGGNEWRMTGIERSRGCPRAEQYAADCFVRYAG